MTDAIPDRDTWIKSVCQGFVHGSEKNRTYYRLVLETLWPQGSTIPGPIVSLNELRSVVDNYRGKPYRDLPRRIRELQGEEGVVGVEKSGNGEHTKYQLIHTRLEPKRTPRTGLNESDWQRVLDTYHNRCPICSRNSSIIRLDQDHKVPRLRGGGDEFSNWQPLCKECNNFKSTACRNCELDCITCPWAFPEHNVPIKLDSKNTEKIRMEALERETDPSIILNSIVDKYFCNWPAKP